MRVARILNYVGLTLVGAASTSGIFRDWLGPFLCGVIALALIWWLETGGRAATKPVKPKRRRGVITVKCTGGSPSNLGIKYEATAEVEEVEQVGAYSRLKVRSVAGNMDHYEVQQFVALVPTEKVTWVEAQG